MRRSGSFAPILVGCLLLASTLAQAAGETTLDRFFGEFVGRTISERDRGLDERDLSITIAPGEKNGFSLAWTTTISRADGTTSRKSYQIKFQPSERENIYSAGMQRNYFGGWVPLDPMKGEEEPYIWARLRGDTMTVYALHVIDDGSYEMQVYERQLTDDGMALTFTRTRRGENLKTITGVLKRKK